MTDSVVEQARAYFDMLVKSRFNELFKECPKVPLLDVAEITMGQSPESSSYNDKGEGMPFFQGKTEFGETFVKINKYCSAPKKIAKPMDILMSVRAPVGAVNITEFECCIGRGLASIRPKPGKTDVWFLFNALKTMEQEISAMGVGSTFTAIGKDDLKKILVPEAPIDVQNEFSSFVQQVDKSRMIFEQEVSRYDVLIKSRFIEEFGSFEKNAKFNDFVVDMTKGPFGSDIKKDLFVPKSVDTYKVYIQGNAIHNDETLGDYYITKEYFDQKMHRFEVHPGDIIVTCDGTMGKLIRLSESIEPGIISASLLKITLDESKILPKFFEIQWEREILPLLLSKVRNGCLCHLPSAKVIGQESVKLPPIEKQKSFVEFVKQVDKSRTKLMEGLLRLGVEQQ